MNFFLKFGKLDYKLIYPFFCLVFSISDILVETYAFERKRGHIVISLFINSIGKIISIFVFLSIKCCCYKNINLIENTKIFMPLIKKENNTKQKYLRNKTLIFLINLSSYIIYIVYYVVSRTEKNNRPKGETLTYLSHGFGFYYCEAIEIIFIFLLAKFLLDYEFYIYNFISLILYIILSIAIDVINYGDIIYESGKMKSFLLIIAVLLFESLLVIIFRNLMDNLYYSPYLICFVFGLMDFVYTLIFAIITTAKDGLYCNMVKNKKKCYLPSIKVYFEDFIFIDFVSLVSSILFKSITYLFNVFTIFYLTPSHIFIVYMTTKFFQNQKDEYYGNWVYFVFPIQLFILMIYLEIIEINIFGINSNTKRNIQDRADYEFYEDRGLLFYIEQNKKKDETVGKENEENEDNESNKNKEAKEVENNDDDNNSSLEYNVDVNGDYRYRISHKKKPKLEMTLFKSKNKKHKHK